MDAIGYTAAMSACEGRVWQEALGLVADTQLRRLEPDVSTYIAAISACEKGGM